jgi:hypothetical protein
VISELKFKQVKLPIFYMHPVKNTESFLLSLKSGRAPGMTFSHNIYLILPFISNMGVKEFKPENKWERRIITGTDLY